MKIHNCLQLSEEWFRLRAGIPTASNFGRILQPSPSYVLKHDDEVVSNHNSERVANASMEKLKKKLTKVGESFRISVTKQYEPSSAQDDYIAELIADIIREGPEDIRPVMSRDMERGVLLEPEARNYYAMIRGHDIEQVGFITSDDGRIGCSPDGIVKGLQRGIEIKCPLGKTHAKYLLEGILPNDYKPQVHGCMVASGFKEWEFLSYCSPMPPFLKLVEWDDYTDALAAELQRFLAKLDSQLARVQAMTGSDF